MAFDELNSLAKDPLVYPMVTGTTLEHAREQTPARSLTIY